MNSIWTGGLVASVSEAIINSIWIGWFVGWLVPCMSELSVVDGWAGWLVGWYCMWYHHYNPPAVKMQKDLCVKNGTTTQTPIRL